MKRLVILLSILLILFAAYDGLERSRLHLKIAELQNQKDAVQFSKEMNPYMQGVKKGLEFKKHQQGHVP